MTMKINLYYSSHRVLQIKKSCLMPPANAELFWSSFFLLQDKITNTKLFRQCMAQMNEREREKINIVCYTYIGWISFRIQFSTRSRSLYSYVWMTLATFTFIMSLALVYYILIISCIRCQMMFLLSQFIFRCIIIFSYMNGMKFSIGRMQPYFTLSTNMLNGLSISWDFHRNETSELMCRILETLI